MSSLWVNLSDTHLTLPPSVCLSLPIDMVDSILVNQTIQIDEQYVFVHNLRKVAKQHMASLWISRRPDLKLGGL